MTKEIENPTNKEKNHTLEEIFGLAEKRIPALMLDSGKFVHIDEFYKDELLRAIKIFFLEIGYARPSEINLPPEKQVMFNILFNYFILPKNKRPKRSEYVVQAIQKKLDF